MDMDSSFKFIAYRKEKAMVVDGSGEVGCIGYY